MKRRAAGLLAILLALPLSLAAALVSVSSSQIRISSDDTKFWTVLHTATGQELLYYEATLFKEIGTSHLVFYLDGNPSDTVPGSVVDMQEDVLPSEIALPVTAFQAGGNGLGSYIEMAKRRGSLVYGVRYTIVSNPRTGLGADTMQIWSWVRNEGAFQAAAGLRVMLDTALIDNSHDGAPLSLDNGATTLSSNTLFQSITEPIPSDWWTYDQFPGESLAARGVVWGNGYNAPATLPDALEFCHWDEVAQPGFYEPHPFPGDPFSLYSRQDSAVVLWFTNTGQAIGGDYRINPGQTLSWAAYYGLNAGNLGASPTPAWTPTPTLTTTLTPTLSPTITRTPSISPTFTISPTFSVSPTISPTFSISPTHSVSPTFSFSPSFSLTFTTSPTPTATLTASPTPTITLTRTLTPSPTVTRSATISPTLTPAGCASLSLVARPPNPNPSQGEGVWLPYLLCRDATVQIKVYDIAGEKIRSLDPYAAKLGANEQYWDQTNDAGARVASGIFLVQIVAEAAGQKAMAYKKLAVLR